MKLTKNLCVIIICLLVGITVNQFLPAHVKNVTSTEIADDLLEIESQSFDPVQDIGFEPMDVVLDPGGGGDGGGDDGSNTNDEGKYLIQQTYYQGFETIYEPLDPYSFANPTYFSRTNVIAKEGYYSLKTTSDSNGKLYDGIQFDQSFEDGSIEAYFYLETCYLYPTLWLRTTTLDSSSAPSFTDGYMLRLYVDYARIYRREAIGWTPLVTYDLGENINYAWWHMKFEVVGTQLNAWVTKNNEFSSTPTFSYDTVNDTSRLNEGHPGISARTTSSITYIDAIKIISETTNVDKQSLFDGFCYAYTGWEGGYYWDLETESSITDLGNFMLNHKWYLVKFTMSNEILRQIGYQTYKISDNLIEFNATVFTDCDTLDYVQIQDIKINGISESEEYTFDLVAFYEILTNNDTNPDTKIPLKAGLVALIGALGLGLIWKGLEYLAIKKAIEIPLFKALGIGWTVLSSTLGSFLFIIGIAIVVIAILLSILFICIENN